MTGMLKDIDDKEKLSLSRVILLLAFSMISILFLVVFTGLLAGWWLWDRFAGALTWGVGFVFVTAMPYFGNSIGRGIRDAGGGGDGNA